MKGTVDIFTYKTYRHELPPVCGETIFVAHFLDPTYTKLHRTSVKQLQHLDTFDQIQISYKQHSFLVVVKISELEQTSYLFALLVTNFEQPSDQSFRILCLNQHSPVSN